MHTGTKVVVSRYGLLSTGRKGVVECNYPNTGKVLVKFFDKQLPTEVAFKPESLTITQSVEEGHYQGSRSMNKSSQFIVIRTKGGTRPNTYAVHNDEETAKQEAIRLAKANPNMQFNWLEIKGSVTNKQKVVNELEIV